MHGRLDHLHAVYNSACLTTVPKRQIEESDCSMNIVVFGIQEDRDAARWRERLDDVLHFVAGHEVDVIDAYRVGKFYASKARPVIVKVRTVWDRRIILSNSSKLKNYGERIYIAPDEPADVRRKKTFDRLKYRAEREHKAVSVQNNVLIIDGIEVFSVVDGFIRNNHG
jgi:hypothetical protein